jgi:hypothetical protein
MNMKKLIQTMTDIEQGNRKRPLKESYAAECGDMGSMASPMAAPENPGNPVTASITLNASGMEHVADLMRLLQQAGLEKAGPVAPPTMPMRMDMERLRDKMNGLESSSLEDDVRESDIEEYTNEPDEEYQDHNYMLDDLAGGLNKPKKMYKPAAKGDNPMAVETIKDRLYNALSEKKGPVKEADLDEAKISKGMQAYIDISNKKADATSKEVKGSTERAYDAMRAKRTKKESSVNEISSDLAKRYTKAAKMDRDFNDDDITRLAKSGQSTRDMHKRNAKRTKGIYRAKSRIENEAELDEISSDLAKRYTKAAKMDRDFNDDDITRLAKSGQSTRDMHKRNAKRTKGIYRAKSRIENEAEVQSPSHELSDMSRQASRIAQMIKRKINSGEQMDDRDYNQLAELGSVLSRLGASFGPKSMKDVMAHMKQYTDDRNEEGHNYPEFNTNRFKELLAMAK